MFINLPWQHRLERERGFFWFGQKPAIWNGDVSVLLQASAPSLIHICPHTLTRMHTHTQSDYWLFSNEILFLHLASAVCSRQWENWLWSFCFFYHSSFRPRIKKKTHLLFKDKHGLVSSSLFPSEPQTDQLPFEVSFMPGTEGQEKAIILFPYLHFIQVIWVKVWLSTNINNVPGTGGHSKAILTLVYTV